MVSIQVHLGHVTRCPPHFLAGYFWYGPRLKGSGHPPKWLRNIDEERWHNREEYTPPAETDTVPLAADDPVTDVPTTIHDESSDPDRTIYCRTRTRVVKPPDRYV